MPINWCVRMSGADIHLKVSIPRTSYAYRWNFDDSRVSDKLLDLRLH